MDSRLTPLQRDLLAAFHGERALSDACTELGATIERLQTAPDSRRRLVQRRGESLVVDLVRDRLPQIVGEKPSVGLVRIDPPEEILVNKLCALLSRNEPRDLVDVAVLEARGHSLESALASVERKEAGFSPGQLAWVLESAAIGEDTPLPEGWSKDRLGAFRRALIDRLKRLSFPG